MEIIVVDGGSTDGTPDLVVPEAALLHSPRGRAIQMNRGAAASRGGILAFWHADSQLPAGWREAVIEALGKSGVSGGTFQTLTLPERGLLLYIRNRTSFPARWKLMYGDQVQFMTRETFERAGGFPEVPGMAVGKGIRIDERCRTNLPHIYAAGDCTETRIPGAGRDGAPRWQTTRIWLDCARQAKVAGRNMANQKATLTAEPFFNASAIYTLFYTFIGEPHGEGQVHIWQGDDAAGARGYRKFRVVDGK